MQLPNILVAVVSPPDPSIIQSALHRCVASWLPCHDIITSSSSGQSRVSCSPAASAPVWPPTPPSRGQSSSQTWRPSGQASGGWCPLQLIRTGWMQVGNWYYHFIHEPHPRRAPPDRPPRPLSPLRRWARGPGGRPPPRQPPPRPLIPLPKLLPSQSETSCEE